MSTDLRNSIYLWISAIAFFGLFWLALRFDLAPPHLPARLGWLIPGLAGVLNLVIFAHGLWQRRASNPNNSNR